MIHLYYKTSSSIQIKETIEAFTSCDSVDISNIKSIKTDNIYMVEIDKVEKSLLLHIKNLLQNKTQNLIYFFINDSHSLILFQLSSILNVKSIITQKNDISKVILNIKQDLALQKKAQLEHIMVKTLVNDNYFMIFDSHELKFASQKMYKDFNCKDLEAIKSKICSQLDLETLLREDTSVQNSFTFTSSKKTYNIKSMTSSINNDKYIYIENVLKDKHLYTSSVDFIKNRIYFIEILKEKILEKSISHGLLGVITLQIENMSNLRNDWSEYEIEMAIRDLLLQVEIEIDSCKVLAQYDNNLYLILLEGFDFEAIKSKASAIQSNISAFTNKQKIKPITGLYAFDINNLELNTVLKIISNISTEEISSKDIETKKLYRIMNIDEELDDARVIDILLQTTFTNKTPIKLLNLYKGLCINTSSVIVKKTEQEIHVTFEQLQGTAMQFEKNSVIQSSNFSKDIIADVKYIDTNKKIVQLKNFRFVQGNANSRKYSRVSPSQRTPISITYKRSSLNGYILDISMNSIAIKTRIYKNIESLKLSTVTLNFTIPVNSNENGYMQLTLTGTISFTICEEGFCKIIISLDEEQANEAILMEYVYNRQKEIIVELKKQTNMIK